MAKRIRAGATGTLETVGGAMNGAARLPVLGLNQECAICHPRFWNHARALKGLVE